MGRGRGFAPLRVVAVNLPAFVHTGTSTATTYHLAPAPSENRHAGYGWALATVNDRTGELQITSDWGNWAHRWSANPAHLGSATLSRFLADPSPGSCSYLADKLTSGEDKHKRERFSPSKTVAHLRSFVLEKRRDWTLGPVIARQLWNDLGGIEHCEDINDFATQFYDIEAHEQIVSDSLHEYTQHELERGYLILRDAILPCLIAAIGERLKQAEGS